MIKPNVAYAAWKTNKECLKLSNIGFAIKAITRMFYRLISDIVLADND